MGQPRFSSLEAENVAEKGTSTGLLGGGEQGGEGIAWDGKEQWGALGDEGE